MTEYVYIIHVREQILLNQSIYKIGKTTQSIMKRLSQYPKGSIPYYIAPVTDCTKAENSIKKKFKHLYVQCTDIGTEYFDGDVFQMKSVVEELLSKKNFHLKNMNKNTVIEGYKNNNDKCREFVNSYLVKDDKNSITLLDFYNSYKKWHIENYDKDIPKRNEFKQNMESLIGKMHVGGRNNGWKGYNNVYN